MFGLLSSKKTSRVVSTRGMNARMRKKAFAQLATEMGFTSARKQKHLVKAFEAHYDSKRRELSSEGLESALKDVAVKRGNGISTHEVRRAASKSEYNLKMTSRDFKEHQQLQNAPELEHTHAAERRIAEQRRIQQEKEKEALEVERKAKEKEALEVERKAKEKEAREQEIQKKREEKNALKEERVQKNKALKLQKQERKEARDAKIEQQRQEKLERKEEQRQLKDAQAEREKVERRERQEAAEAAERQRKERVRAANEASYERIHGNNRAQSAESIPERQETRPNLITNFSGVGAARYAGAARARPKSNNNS